MDEETKIELIVKTELALAAIFGMDNVREVMEELFGTEDICVVIGARVESGQLTGIMLDLHIHLPTPEEIARFN